MSAAKTKTDEVLAEVLKEVADVVVAEELPEVPVVAVVDPAVPVKRAIGPKEAPPFKWKLIGFANGRALTLFKAAEREDVEAQFERIRKEGYYTNLQILDITTKVEQPPQPKLTKKAARVIEEAEKAKAARKDMKTSSAGSVRSATTAMVDAPAKILKKAGSIASRSKSEPVKGSNKAAGSSKKAVVKKSVARKTVKKKK